jgi:DNA polymerase III alpha subunit
MEQEKFAIRFGLGAIKAVGFGVMENAVEERKSNGKFSNIYDFAERLNPRSINKKSIEALAKAGAFDSFQKNRRQIAESFDILSAYSAEKTEEATSNQMSLFGGLPEAQKKPELKKTSDWEKVERLQKEFEAFGFFLNEHPIDDRVSELRKRGVIFSDKLERDELEDGNLVKMAGVIAGSKHRSGPRGRFAYMSISDPLGIFEAMIFDEGLITSARDILIDGSVILLECLIKKDDGGVRILIRDVKKLDDFIQNTKPQEKDFEDIKKQPQRNNYNRNRDSNFSKTDSTPNKPVEAAPIKKVFSKVEIFIKSREPLFSIKAFLSQRLSSNNLDKNTEVFLAIIDGQKITKIELPQKYLLDEFDASKLSQISKVVDVKSLPHNYNK